MNYYKTWHKNINMHKQEEIGHLIIHKIIQKYVDQSTSMSTLLVFENILPLYLITGYIYLKRYLRNIRKKIKGNLISKIFLSCCWISVKHVNDAHYSYHDIFEGCKYNQKEITYIEAHILNRINYDIDISYKEFVCWDTA